MTMKLRAHVFPEGDRFCKWCGCPYPGTMMTCNEREGENSTVLAPEPSVRVMAADDAGTISARIAELKAARDAALSRPEESFPPNAGHEDFGDCCG